MDQFEFYCKKEKTTFSLGYEHITETLRLAMNHVQLYCEELKKIELIDGDDELALYKQLDSNHTENQIVSPIKLENQVNNLLFEEQSKAKALKNENSSAENILQINNLVDKIVREFKNKKNSQNVVLQSKMQNILRNLRVHISISNLLNLQYTPYFNNFKFKINYLPKLSREYLFKYIKP